MESQFIFHFFSNNLSVPVNGADAMSFSIQGYDKFGLLPTEENSDANLMKPAGTWPS